MNFSRAALKTKFKATAIHMSLSIAVFAYLAYQIYYNWYPQPYFEVDGGWQGIRLVTAVDLVLGPLITFLIFDLSKRLRAIVFDLSIILIIQFAALFYGVYITYTQRPVAIVLIDEFMVPVILENYGGKLDSVEQLKQYSDEKPPIIYAALPLDREKLAEINRIKVEEKVLEAAQLQLYRPHSELVRALRESQPLYDRRLDEFGHRAGFENWLREHGKTADEVMIARFDGRYGKAWLVFDRDGKYLSYFYGTGSPARK
ncbi:MAG: hypothetical protein PVI79_05015 [Gammaproteobacteria bacterium]|jgi:hypothetical protein